MRHVRTEQLVFGVLVRGGGEVGYGQLCSVTTNLVFLQGSSTHPVRVTYVSSKPSSLQDAAALLNQVLAQEVHRICLTNTQGLRNPTRSTRYTLHTVQIGIPCIPGLLRLPLMKTLITLMTVRFEFLMVTIKIVVFLNMTPCRLA